MSGEQSTSAACFQKDTTEETTRLTAESTTEDKKKKLMKFKLEAEDGITVTVDEDVAYKSKFLQQMVKNLGIDGDDDKKLTEALPVAIKNGKTLKKIMEYCTKYRNVVYQPKGENDCPRVMLTKDDEKYLDIDSDDLYDLLMGANYLDIPGLLDIVTQRIANYAFNRSVEEIREVYGIVNDFTPEEEEAIRKKFEWLEA